MASNVHVDPPEAPATSPTIMQVTMMPIEHIIEARYVHPAQIYLRFADGFSASLAVELLEMPLDRIDWPTLQPSPVGDKIVVKGIKGDPVPIDSGTLRYLVDEKYAATMDAKLKSLQFTEEELEQLDLNEPPPGFLEQADIDLTRKSWK